MRRRDWILATIGLLVVALGAAITRRVEQPQQQMVLADACGTPVTLLEPRTSQPIGAAVVLHGLSANRRIMQTTGEWLTASGLRVFLLDLPGHGDSNDAFSFGRAEQCAAAAVESLRRQELLDADRLVIVGHSMGGAIGVRLADKFPSRATIAISPGPANLPRRMPSNLLILSAQHDLPQLKAVAQQLLDAAGGKRVSREDFRERRAVEFVSLPRATHVSVLFNPRVERLISGWARESLGEEPLVTLPPAARGALGGMIGLIGLLLCMALLAGALARLCRVAPVPATKAAMPAGKALPRWLIAALFAAALLSFWNPLAWLHIFTASYLAAFLLLSGLALAVMLSATRPVFGLAARPAAFAATFGLLVVLLLGGWMSWQITDLWMTTARWLRFFPMALLTFVHFWLEESTLGAPGANQRRLRFGLFLVLRAILWGALLFALVVLQSGQILILLMALYMLLIALLQRRGADLVWRHTGSAAAAALFSAMLAAWFLAAVFPLA